MLTAAITIASAINGFPFPKGELRPTTAVSLVYEHRAHTPIAAFSSLNAANSQHTDALEWLTLGSAAIPEAKPLTSEERASINEFFWSHFQ
jgi:hypothetical protein